MNQPVIGYCGMTHLGLNSAVASAAHGFETYGFDLDGALVDAIAAGDLPVVEPGLDDLFAKHRDHLTFTSRAEDLAHCDVVYVAPDVPTDDAGQSDLSGIETLLSIVEPQVRDDAVLVVLSQVNPGFTRSHARPAGPLYYQVETLIFGRAVERALYPERFIVGCANPDEPLAEALETYLKAFDCPVLPMRYESAELAKISINMCLVASVTVANTMAEICESIGADWSEIIPSLRLDKRIGEYSYIVPGLGISGGNLERDLASVIRMADSHGTDAGVVRAWLTNSTHRKNWPMRTLQKEVLDDQPDATVAVIGLAYKENTHSTKNSPALVLLDQLKDRSVKVYDPVVPPSAGGEHAQGADSALAAAAGADVVVLMTPWPEFRDIDPVALANAMAGKTVIDPYGLLDGDALAGAQMKHHKLGVAG
ncbi:nucleotide sugar dehydrogenase [Magnetovibrio sp. PR-2]|uniref:nucleotide sugar dehydrogenase n=1 Tax=Magnetovibrio sp. PR-2 TaxID=3120356 RepID=UPI002FCE2AD1